MQAITVAGEMRIFRRILMAVAVPASRDFKRKIDGTRTSNLCEVLALLDRRSECGDGAEADEDGARDVALDRRKARAAAESLAERAGHQRPRGVAEGAEHGKEQPEDEDLHPRRAAARVDELRQEGEEEERRLRVEDVDDDALPVEAAAAAQDRLLGLAPAVE